MREPVGPEEERRAEHDRVEVEQHCRLGRGVKEVEAREEQRRSLRTDPAARDEEERDHPGGDEQRLDDDQRLGPVMDPVQGRDREQDEIDVVGEVIRRVRRERDHVRVLEPAAVRGVPRDVVLEPEVVRVRLEGEVAQDPEAAELHRPGRGRDEGEDHPEGHAALGGVAPLDLSDSRHPRRSARDADTRSGCGGQ